MSLRYAILGVLSAEPMSGWQLVQYFRDSVGYVWSAPQSQIYPELHKMEQAGLVAAKTALRGPRAEKRVYSITEEGEREFERWTSEASPYPPDRDAVRLKSLYFDTAPVAAVRAQLRAHLAHYERRLEQWRERADAIRGRHVPLLQRRLAQRDPVDHVAIVAWKEFAFEGNVARAKAEIDWARRGLELVDRLESERQAPRAASSAVGRGTAVPAGPEPAPRH